MGDQRWRREPVERLHLRGEGVVGRNEVGRGGGVVEGYVRVSGGGEGPATVCVRMPPCAPLRADARARVRVRERQRRFGGAGPAQTILTHTHAHTHTHTHERTRAPSAVPRIPPAPPPAARLVRLLRLIAPHMCLIAPYCATHYTLLYLIAPHAAPCCALFLHILQLMAPYCTLLHLIAPYVRLIAPHRALLRAGAARRPRPHDGGGQGPLRIRGAALVVGM